MPWSKWVATPYYLRPPAVAQNTFAATVEMQYGTFQDGATRFDVAEADARAAVMGALTSDQFNQWRNPAYVASLRTGFASFEGSTPLAATPTMLAGASAALEGHSLNGGFGDLSYRAHAEKTAVYVQRTHPQLEVFPADLPGMSNLHAGLDYAKIPGTDSYIQWENGLTEPLFLGYDVNVPFTAGWAYDTEHPISTLTINMTVHLVSAAEVAGYFSPDGVTVPPWPAAKDPHTALFTGAYNYPGDFQTLRFWTTRLTELVNGHDAFGLVIALVPLDGRREPIDWSNTRTGLARSAVTRDISNGPYRFTDPPAGILQRFQRPRYRYWMPDDDGGGGATADEPYLRMSQRNDGAGIARHPRLNSAVGASSLQSATRPGVAPRVGRTNRYR